MYDTSRTLFTLWTPGRTSSRAESRSLPEADEPLRSVRGGGRGQGRAEIFQLLGCEPLPAVSVAVMHHSALAWTGAFGHADRDARVRATPHTRFRVGSVSKALTSAAVGRLLERGQLDLDAPVGELVPEYPDKGHPITPRQFAAHPSGIPHYEERDLVNRVHYRDVGGRGFVSTAEDLVRFGDAMLQGSLLSSATVDVLWQIQKTSSGEETGYGLGWRWSWLEGHREVGHDGSHVGCTSVDPPRRRSRAGHHHKRQLPRAVRDS